MGVSVTQMSIEKGPAGSSWPATSAVQRVDMIAQKLLLGPVAHIVPHEELAERLGAP